MHLFKSIQIDLNWQVLLWLEIEINGCNALNIEVATGSGEKVMSEEEKKKNLETSSPSRKTNKTEKWSEEPDNGSKDNWQNEPKTWDYLFGSFGLFTGENRVSYFTKIS